MSFRPARWAGLLFAAALSASTAHAARNIIVWMDHRAVAQAERINALGHEVLRYVGGRISPEMETPKLLWLSEHRPEVFAEARDFFDLADFLTWKATGSRARSTCWRSCAAEPVPSSASRGQGEGTHQRFDHHPYPGGVAQVLMGDQPHFIGLASRPARP